MTAKSQWPGGLARAHQWLGGELGHGRLECRCGWKSRQTKGQTYRQLRAAWVTHARAAMRRGEQVEADIDHLGIRQYIPDAHPLMILTKTLMDSRNRHRVKFNWLQKFEAPIYPGWPYRCPS